MRHASGVRRLELGGDDFSHCRDCLSERRLRSLVASHGTPLLILDCGQVRQNYRRLRAALPTVQVHYAVKALPEAAVLSALHEEGSHFDAASIGELELLRQVGVAPSRVMHTHPIKTLAEIRTALGYGCNTFVFDNADELAKFKPFKNRIQLLLRIGFRNADATVDLSKKFGAAPCDVLPLLKQAHRLGLRTIGFSFHVGSQCANSQAHVSAIRTCAQLMAAVGAAGLPPLRVMDMGGGFPAPYTVDVPTIEEFCGPIREAVEQLPQCVRVISEPGRYLVASAGHTASAIVGKANREGSPWYYLDDGIYGSFGAQVFDGIYYQLSVLARGARPGPQKISHLAGPTCDSGDMVSDGVSLPDLHIGDVVVAHVMGAYTCVTANDFNSVKRAKIVALDEPEALERSGT
ncbi:MAG: type III PLP-dependent enzyme, partial [Pseudomonadota bacterium]